MLMGLGHELQHDEKRLVLARQIGQVRAVLDKEQGPTPIQIYPSVRAAVDALRAEG